MRVISSDYNENYAMLYRPVVCYTVIQVHIDFNRQTSTLFLSCYAQKSGGNPSFKKVRILIVCSVRCAKVAEFILNLRISWFKWLNFSCANSRSLGWGIWPFPKEMHKSANQIFSTSLQLLIFCTNATTRRVSCPSKRCQHCLCRKCVGFIFPELGCLK